VATQKRDINLPAPYLKRLWLDPERVPDREAYPFCLPFLADDFELRFERHHHHRRRERHRQIDLAGRHRRASRL
jgi:hypothetical protein